MKRREFITLIGGAVVARPLTAVAQQPPKPVIGFVGSESANSYEIRLRAFRRGLSETGYIEGQNVSIEYRWAEGRNERYSEIATEFVRLKVDIIVAGGNAVAAAKQATSSIPIVFPVAVDPLGSGFVASLARGGPK
jgi:ABC-type uncharacterized transport system substrate-binding protein